ncbi:MAG TPA: stage III sporulation protein AC [Desulfotomaculum sp.]|nr:MAG: stage III sporulation protein AC [Peptococcaceae bacterium BRH_c8a]KJS71904.1 MAG: stage III sporulation protein AC [Desulfotomaculum sp. BICA1-6]HBX22256.1 stage III sporulation protein AC [Desulfotomaculum sp.]
MGQNIDLIFKIAGIGILVAVASMVLKNSGKEDYGLAVTLTGIAVVLVMVIQMLGTLFDEVKSVFKLF